MSNSAVTVDVAPGYYLENQTINVTFNEAVESVAINKDGTPPSISKYIAYDTLNPPNPFISVTEDGAGRVVYDGGFPKLYDSRNTAGNVGDYHDRLRIRHTVQPRPFHSRSAPPARHPDLDVDQFETLIHLFNEHDQFPGAGELSDVVTNPNLLWNFDAVVERLDTGAGRTNIHVRFLIELYVDYTAGDETTFWIINAKHPGGRGAIKNIWAIVDEDTAITQVHEFYAQITSLRITVVDTGTVITILGTGANLHVDNRMDYIDFIRVPDNIDTRIYSSWDLLTPSMKYVMNAVEWVMDKSKVRANNRKVLFLGDSVGSYRIDVGGGNHFNTTIRNMIRHGRWTDSVIKVRTQYSGGYIDARYAELNQYAAVFIMGSQGDTTRWITQASVDDIVRYREDGGGLFLMTDHGPVLGSLQAAQTSQGAAFFHSTNQIANRFGAWFSGDYNRVPVNVGFLRQNYGDHPLYKNMLDSEYVFAGGSESRIFVTSDPTYPPEQVTKQYTTNDGYNVINIMCVMDDGSMVPVKLEYNIVDYTVLFKINGNDYSSGQLVDVDIDSNIEISFEHIGSDVAVAAQLRINGVRVGDVSKAVGSDITYTPLRNDKLDNKDILYINNRSVLTLLFSNPPGMELSVRLNREVEPYSSTKDIIYPKYDGILKSVIRNSNTAPKRLSDSMWHRKDIMDLPRSIDASKHNLEGPVGDMPVSFVVRVAQFEAGGTYRGFFSHVSGGQDGGTVTPNVDQGMSIRDINCPLNEPTHLQLGFFHPNVPTLPVAIYIDDNGPFYMARDQGDDADGVRRVFYSDGIFNIYNYLGTKMGQNVNFRYLYPRGD